MTYPSFSAGEVFRAQDANAVGLWLVKSQTIGTGVSSVTVTDAFSADYDSYKIVISGGVGSATAVLRTQLGVLNYEFLEARRQDGINGTRQNNRLTQDETPFIQSTRDETSRSSIKTTITSVRLG